MAAKWHFLNRKPFSHLIERLRVWVSAGYDGLLHCGSLGLTFLVAYAPRSAPVDCAAYSRPRRVVPTRLGLRVNSIRRSFRPARASVPPVGRAFSRKTRDAGSPHGAEVVAVQP